MSDEKVTVENINTPGRTERVNAEKYHDMRKAYLGVITADAPGQTAAELKAAILPHLYAELFPQGKTAGWWSKTVQLDLEAKGIISRSPTKPLRFYKQKG